MLRKEDEPDEVYEDQRGLARNFFLPGVSPVEYALTHGVWPVSGKLMSSDRPNPEPFFKVQPCSVIAQEQLCSDTVSAGY